MTAPFASVASTPLHALPEARAVLGAAWRPGGLTLTARALALADLAPGARALDMGCGAGATLDLLRRRGLRPLGLDRDPAVTDATLPVARADARRLPLADASLDAVCCECVLSCLGPDREPMAQALAEAVRVLRPGGALILSDCFRRRAASGAPAAGCLAGAPSMETWLDMLDAAGLRARRLEDHSRSLAELAARLVWAGVLPACQAGSAGYFLCIAVKEQE